MEYFDSINIDVAKRKYYNANKVNAVLEELKERAMELVEENKRQRLELEALRQQVSQQKGSEQHSTELLQEMQEIYRETLSKAHARADDLIQNAEAQSEKLTQENEKKRELVVSEMKDCFESLQHREEENLKFLNVRLQQLLSALNGDALSEETGSSDKTPDSVPEDSDIRQQVPESPTEREDDSPAVEADQLKTLELHIKRLAEEISALESEEI